MHYFSSLFNRVMYFLNLVPFIKVSLVDQTGAKLSCSTLFFFPLVAIWLICDIKFAEEFEANQEPVILVFGRSCVHAVSSLNGEVIWNIDLTENRYFKCGVYARFDVLLPLILLLILSLF